jgi:OOP family OmpA-OmpF porin
MKKIIALLAGVGVLGLATAANAQGQTPGWYIGAEAGWTHLNEATNANTSGAPLISRLRFEQGFGVGAVVGYEGVFTPGLRLEGEIAYRSNGVKNISFATIFGPVSLSGRGTVDSAAFMGNAIYDFMPDSRWTPYLGGGVGAARLTTNDVSVHACDNVLSGCAYNATSWRFAYQGIAGVKYALTPAVSLAVDYRYFATMRPSFSDSHSALTGGFSIKPDYQTHNVFLSLAYHFLPPPPPPPPVAAAPPPPPAPAAPPPARQFVVYFEFDKSDLTPEGAKVVQDGAAAYKQTGSARIAVTGYTDLSGTQRYNLALSKRRADTVRAALVRQGVPDGAIAEAWRGKQDPAVPTPDGVREPRNRRVEIVL